MQKAGKQPGGRATVHHRCTVDMNIHFNPVRQFYLRNGFFHRKSTWKCTFFNTSIIIFAEFWYFNSSSLLPSSSSTNCCLRSCISVQCFISKLLLQHFDLLLVLNSLFKLRDEFYIFNLTLSKSAGERPCSVEEGSFESLVHFVLGTSPMEMTLLSLEVLLVLQVS